MASDPEFDGEWRLGRKRFSGKTNFFVETKPEGTQLHLIHTSLKRGDMIFQRRRLAVSTASSETVGNGFRT